MSWFELQLNIICCYVLGIWLGVPLTFVIGATVSAESPAAAFLIIFIPVTWMVSFSYSLPALIMAMALASAFHRSIVANPLRWAILTPLIILPLWLMTLGAVDWLNLLGKMPSLPFDLWPFAIFGLVCAGISSAVFYFWQLNPWPKPHSIAGDQTLTKARAQGLKNW